MKKKANCTTEKQEIGVKKEAAKTDSLLRITN